MNAAAMVLAAPHTLEPRELPLPQIGADDALLRVEACGLCGTDHEQYSGQLHPGHAFIPGHEAVGVIEEIGPAAEQRWGVTRGQRVSATCSRKGSKSGRIAVKVINDYGDEVMKVFEV